MGAGAGRVSSRMGESGGDEFRIWQVLYNVLVRYPVGLETISPGDIRVEVAPEVLGVSTRNSQGTGAGEEVLWWGTEGDDICGTSETRIPLQVGDSKALPCLQTAMVWISTLRSGRLPLHVAMQWKTPNGTIHDIYNGPWKAPRWHVLNTIKKILWGDSFPPMQFFFKKQPTTAKHFITLRKECTRIFGFDSISGLSIDAGS